MQTKVTPAVLVGVCVVIAFATVALCPILFGRIDGHPPGPTCIGNLKQIGLALLMYRNDYDGHWPPAENWCDALQPYTKNPGIYNCPALNDMSGGYAYNSNMVGVADEDIVNGDLVPIVFDATPGWNISGGPELAVVRHKEGINVLFADGHVEARRDLSGLQWEPAPVEDGDAGG